MTYQRRTVGIVAAIVLALLGTMGLVGYVQGAKDDAVAGEKLVKAYVAANKIPAGTSATRLADLVKTEKVPAKVKADDAVTKLSSLKGDVTTIVCNRRSSPWRAVGTLPALNNWMVLSIWAIASRLGSGGVRRTSSR